MKRKNSMPDAAGTQRAAPELGRTAQPVRGLLIATVVSAALLVMLRVGSALFFGQGRLPDITRLFDGEVLSSCFLLLTLLVTSAYLLGAVGSVRNKLFLLFVFMLIGEAWILLVEIPRRVSTLMQKNPGVLPVSLNDVIMLVEILFFIGMLLFLRGKLSCKPVRIFAVMLLVSEIILLVGKMMGLVSMLHMLQGDPRTLFYNLVPHFFPLPLLFISVIFARVCRTQEAARAFLGDPPAAV